MLITFAILANSCGNGDNAPDVSDIKLDLVTKRFDKDIAAIDTTNIIGSLAKLQPQYPGFLPFFLDTLMGFNIGNAYAPEHAGTANNQIPGIEKGLKIFLTYKDYRGVLDTVAKHYPDTKEIDEQLTKGFKYWKYYDPEQKTPQVIYMVSWLNNWGAFTLGNDILAIGLDMFLGKDYPFYKSVGIPDYMAQMQRKEYIPVAAMRALYQDKMPFNPDGKTLLHMMIQRGKEMYFLSKILPFMDETTRLGFTAEQLAWCNANQELVYNFFVKEELLYNNEWNKVLRYVNDAPSATGMPAESPGNIGTWMGYEIVKAYAAQHPKLTLTELIYSDIDDAKFLQESKYKPKQ